LASKLSPAILDSLLPRVPRLKDANLLVGFDTHDDAGVYRISPECAWCRRRTFHAHRRRSLYVWGDCGGNALSDVYAMAVGR